MKKSILRKIIVMGIAIILLGVIPSVNAYIKNNNGPTFCLEKDKILTANITSTIVFEDNFNSGSLDTSKWSIIGNHFPEDYPKVVDGQLHMKCYEAEGPYNWQGVESISFSRNLIIYQTTIKLQMITNVEDNGGFVGRQIIELDCGVPSIYITYYRNPNELEIRDSTGNSVIFEDVEESSDPWLVTFEISDENTYRVTVKDYSTSWTSLAMGAAFKIKLIQEVEGSTPNYYWICGFDNVNAEVDDVSAEDITSYNPFVEMINKVTLRVERLLDIFPNAFPLLRHLLDF